MSSTNKTTNYELSQYIGTDKPTYLGDYNGDMLKIDTQMKTNADNISTTNTLAQNAKDTADGAETHAQTAITNAGNAQTTATSALSKATANEAKLAKFDLDSIIEYTSTITVTNATASNKKVTVATNTDGSIAKIYGIVTTGPASDVNTPIVITIPATNLRPSSNINIQGNLLRFTYGANGITGYGLPTFAVKTNGDIEITQTPSIGATVYSFAFINSLLYITDFGDQPVNN